MSFNVGERVRLLLLLLLKKSERDSLATYQKPITLNFSFPTIDMHTNTHFFLVVYRALALSFSHSNSLWLLLRCADCSIATKKSEMKKQKKKKNLKSHPVALLCRNFITIFVFLCDSVLLFGVFKPKLVTMCFILFLFDVIAAFFIFTAFTLPSKPSLFLLFCHFCHY